MEKRIISLLLLLAMLALPVVLAACGGDTGSDTPDITTAETADIAETEEETPSTLPLSIEKEDNGGRKFVTLCNSYYEYEHGTGEQTGEIVDDAVYAANMKVEDHLGIELEFVYKPGNWNDRNAFNDIIASTVLAGDSTYDMVSGTTVCVMPSSSGGHFYNMANMKYVDFDNPWWIAEMFDRFSVNGILYGVIGDISMSLYTDLSVIFFNVNKLNSYGLENPYELVRSNKWVLDKFIEIGLSVKADLNGDGVMKVEDDEIGFLAEYVPNGTFQTALELPVVNVSGGKIEYLGLSERYVAAYEKLYDFNMTSGTAFGVSSIDDQSFKSMKYFNEGRVLLMANFIYSTEHLRDMEDDYGIIPYPKYDENQDKHLAQLGTSTQMIFIPKTAADFDLTGKVMESLSYYNYYDVNPVYYEVALKEKYARDRDMHEMLDIIREGATFNFTFVYGTSLTGSPTNYFRFQGNPSRDIASAFAANEPKYIAAIEKMAEAYAANEAAA